MEIDYNLYRFNKYQSTLEELDFNSKPKEVQESFIDIITNVPFVRNLVSKDRKHISELPKDENGRAIIDYTNPPLYDNVDEFREVAIKFKETGVLTDLMPSKDPNSAFHKWAKREFDRIYNGMTNSEGMYISGDMYYFLNYAPIDLVIKTEHGGFDKAFELPEFWEGIWWRYNLWEIAEKEGKDFAEIASRRKSKSFTMAAKMSKTFFCGKNSSSRTKQKNMVVAATKEYLTSDGTLNKFEDMLRWNVENNPIFPKRRIKSSLDQMRWVSGYRDLNTNTNKGSLNEVFGLSVKDDIQKPRGKAASKIFFEEFGNFKNLDKLIKVITPSAQQGLQKFSQMIYVGTGGSDGADFQSAREMIYHPKGWGIKEFSNVWDKDVQGGESIFFFPAYINYGGCYSSNGISDVTKAILSLLESFYKTKYYTTDPSLATRERAENPITIQDAIMRVDNTTFPVSDLAERLNEIDNDPQFYNQVYVGEMIMKDNGDVDFLPSMKEAIRNFPHKTNKLDGAVEIYEMPKIDSSTNKAFRNRYYIGYDPVDDDSSGTTSLQSSFVLDGWTDEIVAEYTGRPMFADEYYEQLRRLSLFYNATILYENNKKGFFAYLSKLNSTYLLADCPEFLKSKDILKPMYGNKLKGVNAAGSLPGQAREWTRDWLLKRIDVIKVVDGKETVVQIPNLFKLKSRALIQELMSWNKYANFDRVSAIGIAMMMRKEFQIIGGDREEVGSLSNDDEDFFNSKYDEFKYKR